PTSHPRARHFVLSTDTPIDHAPPPTLHDALPIFSRHREKTWTGKRLSPDIAQKRRRGNRPLPTSRKNEDGETALSRHRAKTQTGKHLSPDIAQKRRRGQRDFISIVNKKDRKSVVYVKKEKRDREGNVNNERSQN